MEENKQSIFRKESLDRVSSPEELDRYLKVTGPGVWFPLLAVAVVLLGVLLWMIFGRLDTTLQVAVISEGDSVFCYIPQEQASAVVEKTVTVAGQSYSIVDRGLCPLRLDGETDENILFTLGLSAGETVQPFSVDASLPEGIYFGEIIVETVNPITFITN